MPPVSTEIFFGPYRLVSQLGKGGMGETWRAVHEGKAGVTKQVVIKRILPVHSAKERFRQSFIQEARLSARLSHGNVAQVFDFGELGGEYYMVMEYVHGRPLSSVLRRAKDSGLPALPGPLAAYFGIGILQGLHHAHTRTDDAGRPLNIVHRDVSPDNVMLSYEGEVKLLDFGIARASTEDRTKTAPGIMKGKVNYASPEQARAKGDLDLRSDIFSTGLVLYRMLAGHNAGDDPDDHKALLNIVHGDFHPLGKVAPWVPSALCAAVDRALQIDRNLRWPTALDFSQALSLYLGRAAPGTSHATAMGFMAWLYRKELEAEGRRVTVPPEVSNLLDETRRDIEGEDALTRRLSGGSKRPATAPPQQATERIEPVRAAPRASPGGGTERAIAAAMPQRRHGPLYFLLACLIVGAAVPAAALLFRKPPPSAAALPPAPKPEPTPAERALEEQRQRTAALEAEIAAMKKAREEQKTQDAALQAIPEPQPAPEAPAPAGKKPGKRGAAAAPATLGQLALSTLNPSDAEVFEGRTPLGTTPLKKLQLEPGPHKLRIFDLDWKPRILEVTIEAGKTLELKNVDVGALPKLEAPAPAPVVSETDLKPMPNLEAAPAQVKKVVLRGGVRSGVWTIDVQNRTDAQWSGCALWVPPNLYYAWPADFRINPREWEIVLRTKFKERSPTPKDWNTEYPLMVCAEGAGYLNREKP